MWTLVVVELMRVLLTTLTPLAVTAAAFNEPSMDNKINACSGGCYRLFASEHPNSSGFVQGMVRVHLVAGPDHLPRTRVESDRFRKRCSTHSNRWR